MSKRRSTKEQEIGDIGELQVHERLKRFGWEPRTLSNDLGEDFIIDIYDDRISAGLAFYVQIKSSEDISKFQIKNKNFSYLLEIKHLEHWQDYVPPASIVLWDISKRCGYWVMVNEVIKRLDEEKPTWRKQNKVKVSIPPNNTMDDTGLKALRNKLAWSQWDTIRSGKNLEMKFDFSFPNEPLAKIEESSVKQFLATGEAATISGKYITGIQFSDWYERKLGKPEINPEGKLVFGPRRSDRVDKIRLIFLSLQGNILKAQNIEIKANLVGSERITFSNEHFPTPFLCHIVIESTGHFSITISLKGSKTSAQESLITYELFEKLRFGGRIRLEVLTNAQDWGNWGSNEMPVPENAFPELDKPFKKILQKLSEIEQKTGVVFSLGDKGIDKESWKEIYRVSEIIETGRLINEFESSSITLSGPPKPNAGRDEIDTVFKAYKAGQQIRYNHKQEKTYTSILGVEVPLGPRLRRVSGLLAKESAKQLGRIWDSTTSPQMLKRTLTNGMYIEEYSDWLTSPSAFPELSPPD